MPTTSEIRSFYDSYIEKLNKPTTRHAEIFNTFGSIALKGMTVLDIGCGAGFTSKYLSGLAGEVVAVDLSPELIKFARKNNAAPNISYLAHDIMNWESQKKFDFISIVDVMEHIPSERLDPFIWTVKKFSHEKTIIYLNVPCYDVLKYLKENQPEILQIVDNPIIDPASQFRKIGFVPTYFRMYWKQYVEYIFQPEPVLDDLYDNIFKTKIRSNVNG